LARENLKKGAFSALKKSRPSLLKKGELFPWPACPRRESYPGTKSSVNRRKKVDLKKKTKFTRRGCHRKKKKREKPRLESNLSNNREIAGRVKKCKKRKKKKRLWHERADKGVKKILFYAPKREKKKKTYRAGRWAHGSGKKERKDPRTKREGDNVTANVKKRCHLKNAPTSVIAPSRPRKDRKEKKGPESYKKKTGSARPLERGKSSQF